MRKLAKWFEEALESYVKLMGNTYGWKRRCLEMMKRIKRWLHEIYEEDIKFFGQMNGK